MLTLIILSIIFVLTITFILIRQQKKKNIFKPDKMMLTICADSIKSQIFKAYPDFGNYPDLINKVCSEIVFYFHDDKLFQKDYKTYKDCKSEKEIVLIYYYYGFMNLLNEVNDFKYEYKKQPKILLDWIKEELKEF